MVGTPTVKRYPRTILAAICLPWDEEYELREELLRRQIRDFIGNGVTHLYLFGTAGEGYAVTDEQYARIVRIFAEEMNGPDLFPMVGQIGNSLPQMRKRIGIAYDLGIRDYQFSLPSWGMVNDRELFAFFHGLCDPFPDCRFMNYNLLRTKRLITPEEFIGLAAEIPNFVGAKFTSLDIPTIHKLVRHPSDLQFFLGELGFGYGSLFGECGLLISLGNCKLAEAWKFFRAAIDRDADAVVRYQQQFIAMLGGLFDIAGRNHMDGAYDKLFCKLMQPGFPLRLLPPYEAFAEPVYGQFRDFLKRELRNWSQ